MSDIISKIKNELLFSTSREDPEGKIRRQIQEENRRFAVIWSVVEIAFWVICLVTSANNEWLVYFRSVYTVSLVINVLTLIGALLAAKNANLIESIMFVMKAALLAAGIGIALSLPNGRTATFTACVLFAPIMFICDTLPTALLIAATNIVYILIG